ncbi:MULTISPECIES: hypothetical protein [Bradyrhizobium]|jgi:hypothetical protein|uniref:hypothetical protein n=1 Tax=Bradyrhizobium TaxID=374 RepID=UPI00041D6FA0|nr:MULTISPECIES: hypothetical protein [Bradyrhizobium]KIU45799.1 hypothetical protein QU41_23230 [Bradyrhizobium elkanii]MBK5656558.1 hypothetical protein [Rhizobium sp.]OCX27181.1 hypothetical protein QU42_31200 [Bradyrhizobium sp. UASWS1016]
MNWASSLDEIWRSPTFPMWLTLAAAGFFGIVVLVTLLRAEKSVANGALTVITLLSIAVAVAATIRGFAPGGQAAAQAETRTAQLTGQTVPALACIDDLAGDAVLNACEKVLFGTSDSAAAAVSYAAAQISRLTAYGDLATAERTTTTELQSLRRAVEHDRYGLMAYALMARDRCTPTACPAFRALGDNHQIIANMNERTYENLITRYAASWSAPTGAAPSAAGLVAALPPSMPTGKPTNAEFPSSANTPPVSIMTPEPAKPAAAAPPPARAAAAPAPKRAPVAKRPVQIAPAPAAPPAAASAPAAASQE